MRRSSFAITVSAIALLAASQALAQEATPIRLGQSVSGSLTAEDTQVDSEELGQYVYDTYSVRLRDGQRIEATQRCNTIAKASSKAMVPPSAFSTDSTTLIRARISLRSTPPEPAGTFLTQNATSEAVLSFPAS